MALTKEKIKSVIDEFRVHAKDTGNTSAQIALLSEQILALTEHLKKCPKDFASLQGLFKMVGQRRRLLGYLKGENPDQYQKLISRLDLRK